MTDWFDRAGARRRHLFPFHANETAHQLAG
jgi:hypothetical protein